MTRWPTAKHFTSWLCLAPANKISAHGDAVCSSVAIVSLGGRAPVGSTDTFVAAAYRHRVTRKQEKANVAQLTIRRRRK
jgi:transposase